MDVACIHLSELDFPGFAHPWAPLISEAFLGMQLLPSFASLAKTHVKKNNFKNLFPICCIDSPNPKWNFFFFILFCSFFIRSKQINKGNCKEENENALFKTCLISKIKVSHFHSIELIVVSYYLIGACIYFHSVLNYIFSPQWIKYLTQTPSLL